MAGTGFDKADRVGCRELMHSHANPNRQLRENSSCNAAMQIGVDSLGRPDHSVPFISGFAPSAPADVQLHRGE
jgi:hypothetical protein